MEKLSETAERVWKVLSQFSEGATAKQIRQITTMAKTTVYNSLKELEEKDFVEHKTPKWFLKAKPSTESDLLKTGLEHGIITKEDLEKQQIINFARSQIPELASDPEISEIIKLVTAQRKIETLKKLKEDSE